MWTCELKIFSISSEWDIKEKKKKKKKQQHTPLQGLYQIFFISLNFFSQLSLSLSLRRLKVGQCCSVITSQFCTFSVLFFLFIWCPFLCISYNSSQIICSNLSSVLTIIYTLEMYFRYRGTVNSIIFRVFEKCFFFLAMNSEIQQQHALSKGLLCRLIQRRWKKKRMKRGNKIRCVRAQDETSTSYCVCLFFSLSPCHCHRN